MLSTTLPHLKCPRCARAQRIENPLALTADRTVASGSSQEVSSGHLECLKCKSRYPILAGVAILVEDVRSYLLTHVKGIAKLVPDSEIPKEFRGEYRQAKREIQVEHIEEDLEAERVIALYVMNHYLRVSPGQGEWWKPETGPASPVLDSLIRSHWDQGPFAQIERWVARRKDVGSVIELGCGVGGLYRVLKPHCRAFLGIDGSFGSIALARHLALGMPYPGKIRIPNDLLQGPVSREWKIPAPESCDGTADFVVGDLENLPARQGEWDLTLALNAIDMLNEPAELPQLQYQLLKKGGLAVQSCPYIWHEIVARELRANIPRELRDSARAVEWLYEQAGFRIQERVEHLPWLFFKHVRQLEIYSVHLFQAVRE